MQKGWGGQTRAASAVPTGNIQTYDYAGMNEVGLDFQFARITIVQYQLVLLGRLRARVCVHAIVNIIIPTTTNNNNDNHCKPTNKS